jgi:hypothetical protein
MAKVSVSRRAVSGIIFIIAGALVVLAAILPLLSVSVSWLGALGYVAIAVALAVLALGGVNSTLTKVLLIAAAVGWLLLALAGLGLAIPAVLITIAAVLAGLGTLIGAIVLYVGKEITNTAALAFIIAAVLGLILLLAAPIGVFPLTGNLLLVLQVLFGVALIVTGVIFRRPERR